MLHRSLWIAASIVGYMAYMSIQPTLPAYEGWDATTLARLQTARQPVRLVGSPTSTRWNTSHWTLAHVVSRLPASVQMQYAPSGVFRHYDPNLELAQRFPPTSQTQTHARQDVLALLDGADGSYYLNDELHRLAPDLVRDVPLAGLVAPDAASSVMVKLWLGGPRVVANLHYDATHNLFHQVVGYKRFLLFPPSAHASLYLFSRLHPNHRQSQLDLTLPRHKLRAAFPAFADVEETMLDVALAPGETLYLPPFWFHCVVTTTPSVSVNVWTDADEVRFLAIALANPVPYLADLEASGHVHDLNSHLGHLQLFVRLVLSRSVLRTSAALQQLVANQDLYLPRVHVTCGVLTAPTTTETMLQPYVDALVAASFDHMVDVSAKTLVALSYVEALVAQFMAPTVVGSFLIQCIVAPE
ncbi:hypothetical protein SPRG_13699 [Saprolegnia parasitica CBS 223.65]|uniref:JmjC domain-containing protein n=1 Tax=Saprolegnia parasitica (strain CBS 223.65) TaxID=695850 RepID=A0A067C4A9_SAPPC|nr:hypothetical protein SPRG_13699 [Saprolegnia parasitica CBS 223.65]KDO21386.1 hypothetical protein SPRG_13699 [Saprolegnia parasitica CBS 223.65]|eukprot:XP_012207941.1 hypothetical protein SPRG_13699 [Saprolegnia parasitica CBS 223.65]